MVELGLLGPKKMARPVPNPTAQSLLMKSLLRKIAQLFAETPEARAALIRISKMRVSADKRVWLEEFREILQLRADGTSLSYQAMFCGFGDF